MSVKTEDQSKNIKPLEAQSLPENCYIFKHSTQCPRSATAAEAVEMQSWELPLYWINVIEQRTISNWVEATYGVRHESPQLLALRGGEVVGHLNHQAINLANIAQLREKMKA
jgi:bacillithiol system protein YtxJ